MERQHAEGRGRRDRGTCGFYAFGRTFPGRTAGADLLSFLHKTSIVIRELRGSESPARYKVIRFVRFPFRPAQTPSRMVCARGPWLTASLSRCITAHYANARPCPTDKVCVISLSVNR